MQDQHVGYWDSTKAVVFVKTTSDPTAPRYVMRANLLHLAMTDVLAVIMHEFSIESFKITNKRAKHGQ